MYTGAPPRMVSDRILGNMVARGLIEPLVAPPSDDVRLRAVAHHEGAHGLACINAASHIVSITLDPALCRADHSRGGSKVTPSSRRAALLCCCDFAGPIAEAKFYGHAVVNDADIRAAGGNTDLRNFEERARAICDDDRNQIEALRTIGMAMAVDLVEEHWDAIGRVADDLLAAGRLDHGGVLAAMWRGGTLSYPATPISPRVPWVTTRRADGRLVEIDERGVVRRVVTRPVRI
jgi:hypothetical protein